MVPTRLYMLSEKCHIFEALISPLQCGIFGYFIFGRIIIVMRSGILEIIILMITYYGLYKV